MIITIVKVKASTIWIMFLSIDSFEIIPKNIPKKIIQIKIIMKEVIKHVIPASATKKKGNIATIPPRNGLIPLTKETTNPVKVSAFS